MKRNNFVDRWLSKAPGNVRFWRAVLWVCVSALIFIGARAILLTLKA